tara:strand:- start:138 stop:605 length:468 start_codon:yes stop_codon:yes gene_type:complete
MNDNTCIICLQEKTVKNICSRCNICTVCGDCLIDIMEKGLLCDKCFTCNKEYPWCSFDVRTNNVMTINGSEKYNRIRGNIILILFLGIIYLFGRFMNIILDLKIKNNTIQDFVFIMIYGLFFIVFSIAIFYCSTIVVLLCRCLVIDPLTYYIKND